LTALCPAPMALGLFWGHTPATWHHSPWCTAMPGGHVPGEGQCALTRSHAALSSMSSLSHPGTGSSAVWGHKSAVCLGHSTNQSGVHWRRGRHHQSVVGVYLHDHPVLPPVVPLAGAEGDDAHRWTLGPVLEVVVAEGLGYSRKSTSHGSIGTGAPTAAHTCTLSYPVFMPKLSTHRMHDPGSNVRHVRPKVLTDNQMS
jgi:hypothetical protein